MTIFEDLLAKLAEAFDQAGIGYMVIGGQAVLVHGEPRQTRDVDVTLALDHDEVDRVSGILARAGLAPLAPDPAALARQTNVLPLQDGASGLRVDAVFSDTPYERQAIERAEAIDVGRKKVRFVRAEDLLIHKLVAGRPVDIQDARGIWLRKNKTLDLPYVERWLSEFAKIPELARVTTAWREVRRP